MHYSKKIYLMLLPLAIFLCLSCPIKHEIKQVLNIATSAEINLEKNNHLRPCIAAFAKEDLSHTAERHTDSQTVLFTSAPLSNGTEPLADAHTANDYRYDDAISPIPLFIFHRKLII